MSYGLSSDGMRKKRLPEILNEIIVDLQTRLSVVTGQQIEIESDPESATGQLLNTFAEREAALWEIVEAIYYAMYPRSAEGQNLDRAVQFMAVKRFPDTPTLVYALVYAPAGTAVTPKLIVADSEVGIAYQPMANGAVNSSAAGEVTIEISVLQASTDYIINVDGVLRTYTSDSTPSEGEILNGLQNLLSTAGMETAVADSKLTFRLDGRRNFTYSLGPNLRTVELASVIRFQATSPGTYVVPANTLTQIRNNIPGVTRVNNLVDGIPGSPRETDSALRTRYPQGVYKAGHGTPPAIKANLQEVPGVTAVAVLNNTTLAVSSGVPAKSFECVIQGGDPQDIANVIYDQLAGGGNTGGTLSYPVKDTEGNTITIRYSRPEVLYLWVLISIVPKAGIEFGQDTYDRSAEYAYENFQYTGIGGVLIPKSIVGGMFEIYNNQLRDVNIYTAVTTDPNYVPPLEEYTTAVRTMGIRQYPYFTMQRIQVVQE